MTSEKTSLLNHSLCLKISLVSNHESVTNNISTKTELLPTNATNYPSKLLIVIKKDSTISDLCRQIEQNVQSMGFHYLYVQYITTTDMFRLPPQMILQEIVTNNTQLIATYSIHYTNNGNTERNNDKKNVNNPMNLKLIIQDWKKGIVNNMAKCYQIMKDYNLNDIEREIMNINLSLNDVNQIKDVNVNINDLMLYTVFLCTCKMQNVMLQSKSIEMAFSILTIIVEKNKWELSDKPIIEFIIHQLICSDYINDKQITYLLNIGNNNIDKIASSSSVSSLSEKTYSSAIDSFKVLTIDTDIVITKIKNINKIIKTILHNSLTSNNVNSNATNTLNNIMNNQITKELFKYADILKCCKHVITYHYKTRNNNNMHHINNLTHIAEMFLTVLIQRLQSLLFFNRNINNDKNNENESYIHQYLDLISDKKIPQKWRQFKIIITGIDVIWKYLERIKSADKISKGSTIITRLKIHLIYVMFLLLEKWEIHQKKNMLFQHSHYNLLKEFILRWIDETTDSVEYCQIIKNKDIENIIQWPIEIQKAYFSKILMTDLINHSYKNVEDALKIIQYIIKYPIIINDDETDIQKLSSISIQKHTNQIDFNFKKHYLSIIQKGLTTKPKQKAKIIEEFNSVLLNRLRFATYSNEQVLLLRLLCLFHKNCKNQLTRERIIRNVKNIYEDGKLVSITSQSYVDLLFQSSKSATQTSKFATQSDYLVTATI